jgi:2'-5' RNA ligase
VSPSGGGRKPLPAHAATPAGLTTVGVAIPVPEPWGSMLQARRAAYGDPLARAIPTHITLMPPTVVTDGQLPAVEEHLDQVAGQGSGFLVRLRGTATFRPVSPVVFIAVVDGIAGCERLERAVRSGVLLRRRRFPYHPHVTVAHDLPDEMLDLAYDELDHIDARYPVSAFTLYVQGGDGVWVPRRDFPLRGRPLGPSRVPRV